MSKLLIPTIIAATVLLVATIAFSPVEQASAVHTQILAGTIEIQRITDLNVDDNAGQFDMDITIDFDGPSSLVALYICDAELGGDPGDDLGITDITIDGGLLQTDAGADYAFATDNLIDDATNFAADDCVELITSGIGSVVPAGTELFFGILANDIILIEIDETDADNDDDADGIDFIAYVLAPDQDTPTITVTNSP